MAVPYTFGTATASIPLSQLDSNFSTTITLGNTAIQLGNTVTTLNNMTLANVTVSSGNVTFTNVSATTANVTTANIGTAIITGTTTLTNLTASTALSLDASKNIASVTNTGTGSNVLSASPTLTGTAGFANITASGTLGVTGVATFSAGTAALPAITTSGDTNTGIFFPAADTIAFADGGTERMRIDSSGNVGIGTSSPVTNLNISSASAATGGDGIQYVQTTYTGTGTVNSGYTAKNYYGTSQFFQWENNGTRLGNRIITNAGGGALVFTYGNDSEGMRINSSGNLLVGTTSVVAGTVLTLKNPSNATVWGSGPDTNGTYLVYNASSVGVYLGSGSTAWSSSSDERTKTAITPFKNALEKVCTLRAGTGRYLKDEETVSRSFLIAQDVQAVLPEAVNVQNDEIGTLGLQYTDVIPLLVAAIQEQQALIASLTARIVALEST